MVGYIGSAKTGDNINQLFYKVACDLSGVKVTQAQIDAQQSYVAVDMSQKQEDDIKKKQQNRDIEKFLNSNRREELDPVSKLQQAKADESKMCNIF